MKPITIELDPSEFRILRGKAYNQVRTPENLARYLIVKGLGLTSDEQKHVNAESNVTTRQGLDVASTTA